MSVRSSSRNSGPFVRRISGVVDPVATAIDRAPASCAQRMSWTVSPIRKTCSSGTGRPAISRPLSIPMRVSAARSIESEPQPPKRK
jgi:hypothetical protein